MRKILFAVVLGVAVLGGCVKTGAVVEQQPLSQKMPRTGTVGVVVKTTNEEWQAQAGLLKEVLQNKLGERGWKASDAPDFLFEITFVNFDKGSSTSRAINMGGEAELHTDVVMKTKDGAVIAKLGVIGNSKRKSSMSVNGVNTSVVDSLPSRAVHATAEEICEYLQTHA